MMNNRRKLQQRGDTIVEILIVLAVIGMALSTSYAIANRSLLGIRQSQEHSEALQLAQTQLEELRALAAGGTLSPTAFTAADPNKCINNGVAVNGTASPTTTCLFALETLTPVPSASGVGYLVTIKSANSTSPNSPNFTISLAWDDVTGAGKDNVSLTYRLPVPSAP